MAIKSTKSVEALLKEKRISEIINPKLVQSAPDITIDQAVNLMLENKSGYIVIAKGKTVVGIFTETDFVRKVIDQNVDWKRPVSDFMTPEPKTLSPEDSVGQVIDLMGRYRFYHIPLVNDKNELVNVISVRTVIRFLAEFYPTEVYNLPPDPSQIMESAEGG